jgi:hypothetical protein
MLERIGRAGKDEQAATGREKVLVPVAHSERGCFKTLADNFEGLGDKVEQGDGDHARVTKKSDWQQGQTLRFETSARATPQRH